MITNLCMPGHGYFFFSVAKLIRFFLPLQVFQANVDSHQTRHNFVEPPVLGRFVRLHVLEWHTHPSMRFELLGCQGEYGMLHLLVGDYRGPHLFADELIVGPPSLGLGVSEQGCDSYDNYYSKGFILVVKNLLLLSRSAQKFSTVADDENMNKE